MCGIVGAVSQRNIVPILIEGLKRLEYRGYDSAGIAVLDIYEKEGIFQRVKEIAPYWENAVHSLKGLPGAEVRRRVARGRGRRAVERRRVGLGLRVAQERPKLLFPDAATKAFQWLTNASIAQHFRKKAGFKRLCLCH